MWVIAGLGNPGTRYHFTRHNLGFLVADLLAARMHIRWQEKKGLASLCSGRTGDRDVLLVKPQTYMNLSGQPLRAFMRKKGLAPESLVVVHDDLDMAFGRLKIREGGGAGGHKGVLSIQQELGCRDFLRVKMGIGRPPGEMPAEKWVLSRFSEEEKDCLGEFLDRGADAVECILLEGAERAMNTHNGRNN